MICQTALETDILSVGSATKALDNMRGDGTPAEEAVRMMFDAMPETLKQAFFITAESS